MRSFLSLLLFVFYVCIDTIGAAYPSTNCYYQNAGLDLAKCAFGYGGGMKDFPVTGGQTPYQVTSDADSGPGTLRDALSQSGRFITFSKSMTIVLTSASLRPKSDTTIDARGQSVVITGKSLRLYKVSNIIISNIAFINLRNYPCKCSDCDKPKDTEYDDECADAVNVQASSRLWFVHCTFANSYDGLLDMKDATHHVTVSHSKFYAHDKVMLIGSGDTQTQDKAVRVTIAYNYFFGTGQRTPRVRFGVAHVYNNVYEAWTGTAMGASSSPTIISEGNFFIAGTKKDVADFKSAGIYVSRNDRLLNGAKPIPTAGLQSTTITDYEYVILATDDRRRALIVRAAGVNVPSGIVAKAAELDGNVFTGAIELPNRGSTCTSNLLSRTESSMEATTIGWSCTGTATGTGVSTVLSATGSSSLRLATTLTSTAARCTLNVTGLASNTKYALYAHTRLTSGILTTAQTIPTIPTPFSATDNDTTIDIKPDTSSPARAWFGVRNGKHIRITSTSSVFAKHRIDLITPTVSSSTQSVGVTLDVVLDAGQVSSLFVDDVVLVPVSSLSSAGCVEFADIDSDGNVVLSNDETQDDSDVTLSSDTGSIISAEPSINPYYTSSTPARDRGQETNAAYTITPISFLFFIFVISIMFLA